MSSITADSWFGTNIRAKGQRIKSPFKSVDVDDLLSEVRNSSNRVRACSEGMMDKFLVETHMTVHDSYEITQNIQTTTHKTGGDVEELRGTIEQLVQQQKDFQLTLESMSGKNNLLSFLQEYLSKIWPIAPLGVLRVLCMLTNLIRTWRGRRDKVTRAVATSL